MKKITIKENGEITYQFVTNIDSMEKAAIIINTVAEKQEKDFQNEGFKTKLLKVCSNNPCTVIYWWNNDEEKRNILEIECTKEEDE